MGSRNGHAPIYMWYTLTLKGYDGMRKDVEKCLRNANLLKVRTPLPELPSKRLPVTFSAPTVCPLSTDVHVAYVDDMLMWAAHFARSQPSWQSTLGTPPVSPTCQFSCYCEGHTILLQLPEANPGGDTRLRTGLRHAQLYQAVVRAAVQAMLDHSGIKCMLNSLSSTVVFERPKDEAFVRKWQLACEVPLPGAAAAAAVPLATVASLLSALC